MALNYSMALLGIVLLSNSAFAQTAASDACSAAASSDINREMFESLQDKASQITLSYITHANSSARNQRAVSQAMERINGAVVDFSGCQDLRASGGGRANAFYSYMDFGSYFGLNPYGTRLQFDASGILCYPSDTVPRRASDSRLQTLGRCPSGTTATPINPGTAVMQMMGVVFSLYYNVAPNYGCNSSITDRTHLYAQRPFENFCSTNAVVARDLGDVSRESGSICDGLSYPANGIHRTMEERVRTLIATVPDQRLKTELTAFFNEHLTASKEHRCTIPYYATSNFSDQVDTVVRGSITQSAGTAAPSTQAPAVTPRTPLVVPRNNGGGPLGNLRPTSATPNQRGNGARDSGVNIDPASSDPLDGL